MEIPKRFVGYPGSQSLLDEMSTPDLPQGFGVKQQWYAVRTEKIQDLANYLGLQDQLPCNWKAGIVEISNLSQPASYITPPVDGWCLITEYAGTADSAALAHGIIQDLKEMSKKFGEAQYFQTHRGVDCHAWMKAIQGELIRAYSYNGEMGEIILNEGESGQIEKLFNLLNSSGEFEEEADSGDSPDEELVFKIAADWSIDPSMLDLRTDVQPALGILGFINV